ncbi:MAG: 3-keto-disaccharide hydrolase [Lentimonas sp.]
MRYLLIIGLFFTQYLGYGEFLNDKEEPRVVDQNSSIELIKPGSFEGWKVPSDCWSIEGGTIIGDSGPKPIHKPEWIYTELSFSDFVFSCELKLTGSRNPNSGIYFRVKPIQYQWKEHSPIYEAATGYEYDVAVGKFMGSLGDWYSRPKLRIFPDRELIDRVYKDNDWNRMTLRARGNRIEYWLNGEKIMDYVDEDPNANREGAIGLQIHNNALMCVEMRNARVRPL